MDLYEEALYAQAVRERQRRVAMQREIELRKQRQIEAMMQRMAIESALRDYAEREYQRAQRQAAWERKRAERDGARHRQRQRGGGAGGAVEGDRRAHV